MTTYTQGPNFSTISGMPTATFRGYRDLAFDHSDDPEVLEKIADQIEEAAYTVWEYLMRPHGIYLIRDGSSLVEVGDPLPSTYLADQDMIEETGIAAEEEIGLRWADILDEYGL